MSIEHGELAAIGPGGPYRASLAPLATLPGDGAAPGAPPRLDLRTRPLRADEVVRLLRDGAGRVVGAVVLDSVTFQRERGELTPTAAQGLLVLYRP